MQARGARRFPDLTSEHWLWGGTPEAVAETIRVGINSPHPESRVSQMLAFGRDGVLQRDAINNVVAYVRSLSGETDLPKEAVAAGGDGAGDGVVPHPAAASRPARSAHARRRRGFAFTAAVSIAGCRAVNARY